VIHLHVVSDGALSVILAALATISVTVASSTAVYVVRQLRPGHKQWRGEE